MKLPRSHRLTHRLECHPGVLAPLGLGRNGIPCMYLGGEGRCLEAHHRGEQIPNQILQSNNGVFLKMKNTAVKMQQVSSLFEAVCGVGCASV